MIEASEVQGRWIAPEARAVFRISGPDRVRYLNGQLSNNVAGPLDRAAIPACVCSLKGKVEALVWVSALGDDLVLDGELRQRDFILERLDRYLIADDCEIVDETETLTLVHHFEESGPGVVSRRLAVPGRDRWLRDERHDLREPAEIGEEEWAVLQIRSGVPESGLEITGGEFPAELGLDTWAVDFHKGCYLGQEVVSRIHSVGKVKRVLRVIAAEGVVARDSELRNELGETGRATRQSLPWREKKSLGFGLFKRNPDSPQVAGFEPVMC
ncbi:MAG: hypothetical protein WD342_03210 [Verrucomicrobiales bacterium]